MLRGEAEKLEFNENGSPTINITDEAIVMDDLTISSGYLEFLDRNIFKSKLLRVGVIDMKDSVEQRFV
jgi:hypothetical protein